MEQDEKLADSSLHKAGDTDPADDRRTTGTTGYLLPVKTRNIHALKIVREANQIGLNTHVAEEKGRKTNIIIE